MLFSIFAWHYALQFLEGTSEGGDALETAFGSNLFQRVFGMLLHEGNALLLYAQAVDIVVEGRLLYMCKIVAQVGAVGAYMGGQFLDGKSSSPSIMAGSTWAKAYSRVVDISLPSFSSMVTGC